MKPAKPEHDGAAQLVPGVEGTVAGGTRQASMESDRRYAINLEARYGPLEIVDLPALVEACRDPWYNQTLCRVNDCVVRLGVFLGEFHWHKHDKEDEFFHVVSGCLIIDLEGRTVDLHAGQGFTIPRGVLHRTRALERTVALMVEGAGVAPTGD
jgi:mannose-6-phosphate isomerase-like protein (cupin superfamily)